jgi:hypothetical protein
MSGAGGCFSWNDANCLKLLTASYADPDETKVDDISRIYFERFFLAVKPWGGIRVSWHRVFGSWKENYAPA